MPLAIQQFRRKLPVVLAVAATVQAVVTKPPAPVRVTQATRPAVRGSFVALPLPRKAAVVPSKRVPAVSVFQYQRSASRGAAVFGIIPPKSVVVPVSRRVAGVSVFGTQRPTVRGSFFALRLPARSVVVPVAQTVRAVSVFGYQRPAIRGNVSTVRPAFRAVVIPVSRLLRPVQIFTYQRPAVRGSFTPIRTGYKYVVPPYANLAPRPLVVFQRRGVYYPPRSNFLPLPAPLYVPPVYGSLIIVTQSASGDTITATAYADDYTTGGGIG